MDYADTSKITKDPLLIVLLFQGMIGDFDKTKVMKWKPSTFNEARKFILEMETIQEGIHDLSGSLLRPLVNSVDQVLYAAKSSYKKNVVKTGPKRISFGTSERCGFCGSYKKHPREDCPARKSTCHGCGQSGH